MMHRITAWLALLAVLLATLAPHVSFALPVKGSDVWIEVCSHQGTKLVKLDGGETQFPSTPTAKHPGHCAFCLSHAGPFDLAPATGHQFPVLPPEGLPSPLYHRGPLPLFLWTPSQSRAPPRSSV
jgi:hypothetical protein